MKLKSYRRHLTRNRARVGAGVVEVLVSVVLLSVVLGLAASMSTQMLRYRANVDRQRVSTEAANNLLEVAMALPYDRVDVPTLKSLTTELGLGVENAVWEIQVDERTSAQIAELDDAKSAIPGKKISVLVSIGENRAGTAMPPQHASNALQRSPLVAWRYPLTKAGDNVTGQAAAKETQP